MLARRWKPSPLLLASAVLHLGVALAWLLDAGRWPLWLGLLVLDHGVLTLAGLLPRCQWLGPTLVTLPAPAGQTVALTIDDGPDPVVTPQVLAILARYQARATFFCIGHLAARHPECCRAIVAAGHQIENHGYSHAKAFATFGPQRMQQDIQAAQRVLADCTGRTPRFFRATAGLRNPFLEPVLCRLGLGLAAWTRRAYDTRCTDPDIVLARLSRNLQGGDILLLHDGNAALTASGQPVILAVLPRLLDLLQARSLTPVTLDEACHEHPNLS